MRDLQLVPRGAQPEAFLEMRACKNRRCTPQFIKSLLQMYLRYAERMAWQVEVLLPCSPEGSGSLSRTVWWETVPFRQFLLSIQGAVVQECLPLETGIHRVKAMPQPNDPRGADTADTVANVLLGAEELYIDPRDLSIDHVTVRPGSDCAPPSLVHRPTGLQAPIGGEGSQLHNRDNALRLLRARLRAQATAGPQPAQERSKRAAGDPGMAPVRIYDFATGLVWDQRLDPPTSPLAEFLDGALADLVPAPGKGRLPA